MERRIPLFLILVSFCIFMNSFDRIIADDVCTVYEFKCKNQRCILKNWLCDKTDDCGDGSDEENCSGKIPGKPRLLKAIPLNATSVYVSWMPPDADKYTDPILSYELVYRDTSSREYFSLSISAFKSSVSLHNLKPSSTYIFSISAANNIGRSLRSDDVIVKLEKKAQDMISFGARAVNSSSIMASWNVTSQMNVVGYFLQVKQITKNKSLNSAFKLTVPLSRHEKKYEVSNGIKPGTTYKVTLQLYMRYGFGQIAGPVFVRTPRENIQPPNFEVSLVKEGSGWGVASLKIQQSDDTKALLVRFGKSLTQSFPLKDEKLRILPGDFKGGEISVKAFYWYFFAISKQTSDNRWSRERSIWLRGPIRGLTAVPSSNSILLMWAPISTDDVDDFYLASFKTLNSKKETRLVVRKNLKRGFTTVNIANLRPNTVYDITVGSANASCRMKSCRREFVKTLEETKDEKRCGPLCSKVLAPICASDGKSYDNLCSMKKAACAQKRNIVFKHVGYCCYKSCPDVDTNVCGSDGTTYQSECHLKQASCLLQREITIKHQGSCCDQKCPEVEMLVCGNDGKTYDNICIMERAACEENKNITMVAYGKCTNKGDCHEECKFHSECKIKEDGSSSCLCNLKCPKIASPVCASDGNSYYNLCTMKKTSCLKKEIITLKHNGICENKCEKDEFKCKNNKCIQRRLACDRIPDCSDGSDEDESLCYEK